MEVEHAVDLINKRTQDGGDFLKINPKGQVPALILDDGDLLTEVPAVLQYIADLAPDSGLAPPPHTRDRYRLQEWLNFVTAELHKGLGLLFKPDLPGAMRQIVLDTVATRFDFLERHLTGNDYLLNARFTVADSYAFTIVNWHNFFDIDLSPWPGLVRYMQRIGDRRHVQDAIRAESTGNE